MTAKKIVLSWLTSRVNSSDPWFYSYNFEQELPIYGRAAHQKVHTPSTYSRAFRKIREENTLSRYGLELEEIKHNNNKAKGWKIKKTL
jgi:hypothetical protein